MKPEPQWMKLNVDGARMSLSGRTGVGGGWITMVIGFWVSLLAWVAVRCLMMKIRVF